MAANDPMILSERSQVVHAPHVVEICNIFNNSTEGLCIRDLISCFTWSNRSFLRLLGLNVNVNLIGARIEELHTSLDLHKLQILHAEKRAMELNDICHVFFPVISPDTQVRTLSSISIQPIINDDGLCNGTYWRITKPPLLGLKFLHDTDPVIAQFILDMKSPFQLFTMNEWNVAWPVFMGWRECDIARNLNITTRHFRRVLKTCYLKLSVKNFDEFHNVISKLGWGHEIPERIPYITDYCCRDVAL